ncbi:MULTISPECIES: type I-B CRISPR-associated protein Cas5b [Dyadobacter]|uniref:CRISPR-associated protein Cas5h n=1 Tax=Dyadobacter jejuensis TaxID=1082580 RepID=A0A316AJ51_9BACT|nr:MULTISPECIES: type I-B CRISPR-associated protein Cas5b [Dyadobacter]PWJ57269.1 CRISPR-associated protein Cas5h [Dyadobacter jejuensis]
MKILAFDIWGEYAHFKKIYATTSALTYAIPPKTSLYGFLGAILGLEKQDNKYLEAFANKSCLVGISLNRPLIFQRLGINLKAELGRKKEGSPPKPTLTEFIHQPHYRIYVSHTDLELYSRLKNSLQQHKTVYTPTLGLASLISNFAFIGEYETDIRQISDFVPIESVIPRRDLIALDTNSFKHEGCFIMEQSLYSLEMDLARNVTDRDDIILERKGSPISAKVNKFYTIDGRNICLF